MSYDNVTSSSEFRWYSGAQGLDVAPTNKTQIKKEIEKAFGVKVVNVNTVNAVQKKRRVGRYTGLSTAYKKAYVKLAEGSSIEY